MARSSRIDVVMQGPGTLDVGLVDGRGRMLLRRQLVASGDRSIEVRTHLPLSLQTTDGEVDVVAVLIPDGRRKRASRVTFNGMTPDRYTATRSRQLRVPAASVARAASAASGQDILGALRRPGGNSVDRQPR
jgi:hypothetical protein